MSALPVPRPGKPLAELVRRRDPETSRVLWALDGIETDPKDGSAIRTELAARDSMRAILDDAIELEKRGYYVSRGGLAR